MAAVKLKTSRHRSLSKMRRISLPWSGLSILQTILVGALILLVVIPLAQLLLSTLTDSGLHTWREVIFGRIAPNLLWRPLRNSLMIGLLVGSGTVLIGGYLSWLVVMTDMPGRQLIGSLASIPYIIPSFAIALAWMSLFRNDLLGGRVGLLPSLGVPIPDWLAWGFSPIVFALLAHYSAIGFSLIAPAMATVNSELVEAAYISGASRAQVMRDIIFPIVTPALLSAALLSFANSISNFAAIAILGLPVRFETLSTRIFGMIRIGQVERGYCLTIILILIAALVLWLNHRIVGPRREFTTLSGKGGRRQRQSLGKWRWPFFFSAFAICAVTTLAPLLTLLASSLARKTNSFTGGFTLHYWFGLSNPVIAQGQAGVLRNPQVLDAARNSLLLGLSVAVIASGLGLLIGYVTIRNRNSRLNVLIESLSYVPFFIPGIAFGAIYVAQFGRPIGPLPALYGTFLLLILSASIYNLPFTSQAGRSAMSQIAFELEEAASMAGARFWRRLANITLPLALRGIVAGAVLVFIKIVRDLSLVVLLVTPTTSVLSVTAFQYASEGFTQFANAITVIIAFLSITVTLLVRRWEGSAQPWLNSEK
ncbi:MAG: iron ABC transporter permease [Leptolyngbyaceae cyanobacterium MO_188.B28]|nr:iron ABC transporter permease [Leptolyngbyaceae cyanobacterium MO_188.B28]